MSTTDQHTDPLWQDPHNWPDLPPERALSARADLRLIGDPVVSEALHRIQNERIRQFDKHGDQSHLSDLFHLAVVTEELGESSREVIERDYDKLVAEVVQLTASGLQWLETVLRRTEVV